MPVRPDLWENLLTQSHVGARIALVALQGAAGVYGFVVALRELGFAKNWLTVHRLPSPVISIGNITAGGTGKTPATIWLVRSLKALGGRLPVILSRGYGQDEVELFRAALPDTPHFTHHRRFEAGLLAIRQHGERLCFVLDDGFQHRRLYRDLDIVLIDATQPFGYGHMLPRGLLRESLSHLRRAQVLMLSKCDLVSGECLQELSAKLKIIAPHALLVESVHRATAIRELRQGKLLSPQALAGKRCLLFAGIGRPLAFRHTAENLGIQVADMVPFFDHHAYTPKDWFWLMQRAHSRQCDGLLTTAKDAVKLGTMQAGDLPLWVLDIELVVRQGEKELLLLVQKTVSNCAGSCDE
jgi:tetraacyldisaccharide 4'-kinase